MSEINCPTEARWNVAFGHSGKYGSLQECVEFLAQQLQVETQALQQVEEACKQWGFFSVAGFHLCRVADDWECYPQGAIDVETLKQALEGRPEVKL